MSQVINTNVMSLNAQRNLNQSQGALAQSLERLSSGLRINSAKDDAAGLAISERFTSQINGLDQAVRNSNDGISLAQTAEGALDTVSDSLQRARELAVQAANDSNSASDRQALNDEVQQLMDEVGRIANNTEFNGGRILDGSVEDLFFQVGANQGQMIGVDGVDARNTNLGAAEVVGDGALDSSQLEELAGFSDSDVTITVDGADPIEVALDGDDIQTMDDAVRAINSAISEAATEDDVISDASLEAALRVNNDGETSISITGAFGTGFTVDGGRALDEDDDNLGAALFGDNQGDINNGGDNNVNLTEIDVTTRDTATQAIGVMDGALTQISSLRSELGAVQTRFESTISNLEIGSENLSDARSRIMDADFAAETAELTRAEVLQQAGTSVLSQANAVPQNVLGLLQ